MSKVEEVFEGADGEEPTALPRAVRTKNHRLILAHEGLDNWSPTLTPLSLDFTSFSKIELAIDSEGCALEHAVSSIWYMFSSLLLILPLSASMQLSQEDFLDLPWQKSIFLIIISPRST